MQHQEIECNSMLLPRKKWKQMLLQLLLRTPYRPEKCRLKKTRFLLHVAKTKNATTRNCTQNDNMRRSCRGVYLPLRIAAGGLLTTGNCTCGVPQLAINTSPVHPAPVASRVSWSVSRATQCVRLLEVCCARTSWMLLHCTRLSKGSVAYAMWTSPRTSAPALTGRKRTLPRSLWTCSLHCHRSVHVWHLAGCPHHD